MWWTLSRGNRPRNLGVGAGTTAHPSTTTVPPCTMELPSCTTLPSSTTFEQLLCVFYTRHFSGTLVLETVACFIATCMPGPPSVFVCTWPSALALYIRSVQTYSHCKYTNQEWPAWPRNVWYSYLRPMFDPDLLIEPQFVLVFGNSRTSNHGLCYINIIYFLFHRKFWFVLRWLEYLAKMLTRVGFFPAKRWN